MLEMSRDFALFYFILFLGTCTYLHNKESSLHFDTLEIQIYISVKTIKF